MNRVWDYISFAVWFAGLGYIAMWLFGSPGHLVLPPGLHAIGVAAVMLVPVRLLLRATGARRHGAPTAAQPRMLAAVLRPWRKPPCRRPVKPRSHFGLRGMPD
jgi:hypothetical protein